MIRLKQFLLLTLLVWFFSCENEPGHTYAIKDFRKSLQPFLYTIVSKGVVTYQDKSQLKSITDDELIRLGKSENPVLRATALKEMLDRSSFRYFDIVMNHLDDTAMVAVDNGEFGIGFETVSDYLLGRTCWETYRARNKTIEKVLTKHNYLRSAYTILLQLEPQEKYYPYIKDMATRPRRLYPFDSSELGFNDIEYALYGLAKFKKKEDIQSIKHKLAEHVWELSDISFQLMKEFPDTAYLDVLESYHRRQFYRFSGNRPHGFSGFYADRTAPEDFIQALVVQRNDSSAKLLDTILTNLPRYTCMPDKETIINEVIKEIWRHPCPAYTRLREVIKPKAEKLFKGQIDIEMEPTKAPIDTTRENIWWY